MSRDARLAFEPLADWPYPPVARRSSPFRARWIDTTDLLLYEAERLGTALVVIELDLSRTDLRQDGQIRANARLSSDRVRVSMDTAHGPMRFACDHYDAGTLSWQANVRAVALTMQALRAVERYGAVHSAEQYQGFLALEAPAAGGFVSADAALGWLRERLADGAATPTQLVRRAAKVMHPDVGGSEAEWARLDEARELLAKAGML